jgi:uncharacterized phiE125 gp8 family phage protein
MIRNAVGRGNTRVVSAPSQEPVSIDQAIAHLRENVATVDLLDLAAKITEARAICEDYTGRALAPQVIEWAGNRFPGTSSGLSHGQWCGRDVDTSWNELELPLSPVLAIDSIIYVDADGDEQTMDPDLYRLDFHSVPAVVYLPVGGTWPSSAAQRNGVRIRYYAGYDAPGGSPDNNPLPPAILAAMKLMLGHLWENREAVTDGRVNSLMEIPLGIARLLGPWKTSIPIA